MVPSHHKRTQLSGVVHVDKPAGVTSRDVVNVVQNLVRPARTGHAGTLDPLATGVLVICVGAATRLIDYVQREPKNYRATFQFGQSSPTEDTEGEITLLPDAPEPTRAAIIAAAARLTGEIQQRPPAYSALWVGGRRSYDLARAGREVELAPRAIMIHSIDVVAYEYPELTLDIRCGSGTYIRSLGRDLAETLGTAAVMSSLVRTAIGPFQLADAWPCDQLQKENRASWLRPMQTAVTSLPVVTLTPEQISTIAHGQFVPLDSPAHAGDSDLAAFDAAGQLVAILKPRGAGLYGAKFNLA